MSTSGTGWQVQVAVLAMHRVIVEAGTTGR